MRKDDGTNCQMRISRRLREYQTLTPIYSFNAQGSGWIDSVKSVI